MHTRGSLNPGPWYGFGRSLGCDHGQSGLSLFLHECSINDVDSVSAIHLHQDVPQCSHSATHRICLGGEAVVYVHFPVMPAELMWPGIGQNSG